MNTTVYFAPDAVGSDASYFFDGAYMYERVHGLGSLGALHGWLRRIGKKIKKIGKKVVKLHKKIGKKVLKVAKKVGKTALKVIHKALPIASTVLSFIPGVGWAASAALMAAQVGLDAWDKSQKKKAKKRKAKKRVQQMIKVMNEKTTRLAKPAKAVTPINRVDKPSKHEVFVKPVKMTTVKRNPSYSINDFIKINNAIQRNQVKPENVAALVQQVNQERLQRVLN